MVYVCFPLSIDFLEAIKYIAQNNPAPIPEIIPNRGMSDKSLSKTPVIMTHPKMARAMQIIFFEVIFSPNKKNAITIT